MTKKVQGRPARAVQGNVRGTVGERKARALGGPLTSDSDEYWGHLRVAIDAQGDARTEVFYLAENRAFESALEAAVRQNNRTFLLAMLDQKVPVPPLLLPALAEAIRVASRGSAGGRPRKFTSSMEDVIRLDHWRKTTFGELTSDAATQELVDELKQGFDVSKRTIERVVTKAWRSDEPVAEYARLLTKAETPQPPDVLS